MNKLCKQNKLLLCTYCDLTKAVVRGQGKWRGAPARALGFRARRAAGGVFPLMPLGWLLASVSGGRDRSSVPAPRALGGPRLPSHGRGAGGSEFIYGCRGRRLLPGCGASSPASAPCHRHEVRGHSLLFSGWLSRFGVHRRPMDGPQRPARSDGAEPGWRRVGAPLSQRCEGAKQPLYDLELVPGVGARAVSNSRVSVKNSKCRRPLAARRFAPLRGKEHHRGVWDNY